MRPHGHASPVTYRNVGRVANEVVYATRLPFDPGSPAGAQRPTWRGVGARCSQSVTVSWHAKVTRTFTREIQRHIVEDLSLSSGASSTDRTFQAEHHLLVVVVDLPSETKKATHWVALTCGGVYARSSENTSRKGRTRCRAGAPDRSYAGTTWPTPSAPVRRGSWWMCRRGLTWVYQLKRHAIVTHAVCIRKGSVKN